MRKPLVALFAALALTVVTAAPAFADAPPPTQGGNGGGSSGQCTGSPDDRPAVCPAT